MTRLASLLLLAAACGACATLRLPDAAPLPPEDAAAAPVGVRVEGIVTDRWGYLVPDAWITVRVGSPGIDDGDCANASHLPTRTRSTSIGEFSVIVEAGRRQSFSACLEVEALPPRNRGLRENSAIVPSAPFTPEGAAGGGDVVRVHVVLF